MRCPQGLGASLGAQVKRCVEGGEIWSLKGQRF